MGLGEGKRLMDAVWSHCTTIHDSVIFGPFETILIIIIIHQSQDENGRRSNRGLDDDQG